MITNFYFKLGFVALKSTFMKILNFAANRKVRVNIAVVNQKRKTDTVSPAYTSRACEQKELSKHEA